MLAVYIKTPEFVLSALVSRASCIDKTTTMMKQRTGLYFMTGRIEIGMDETKNPQTLRTTVFYFLDSFSVSVSFIFFTFTAKPSVFFLHRTRC